MTREMKIRHELAEVTLKPAAGIVPGRLKSVVQAALDSYAEDRRVSASTLHSEVREMEPERYGTPGYYLNLYRLRAGLTQAQFARKARIYQHHVSEMEHNRRPIGRVLARRFAGILDCDYRRLL